MNRLRAAWRALVAPKVTVTHVYPCISVEQMARTIGTINLRNARR